MSITYEDPRPRADVPAWRVIAALILSAAVLTITHHPGADTPATSPDLLAACQEDEPCWDCSTMGNRTCGPRHP